MSPIRLALRLLVSIAIFCALLFIPAGTFHWWRAWVLIGLFVAIAFLSLCNLPRDLIRERMKPLFQKDQPLSDKLILIPFILTYLAFFAFIPVDVFRLHLFPAPGVFVSSLGLLLFLCGSRLVHCALKENSFAAPVVKHQTDRQHVVIATGVYAVVRHPMYAGIIPTLLGIALWLQSYAAAALIEVPLTFLALRIVFEESFLRKRLPGYVEYTKAVRYRLIPHVW